MSKFTFEDGNTRAILRAPFYLLGLLASWVVPRTDRLWVFGSGAGLGEGALVLYAATTEDHAQRRVWLATSAAELEQALGRGLDAVAKSSIRGLWLTLRARVLVVTHGLGDVNRYGVHGGLVVQLWHGVPLKKLHLDSPVARASRLPFAGRLLTRGYRSAGRQLGLFPVAGARVADRISSAFGLAPDRVVVTGDPRDDVLLQPGAADRAAELLHRALGPLPAGRVLLYAPTWRDGAPDPALPDRATWAVIADWLERSQSVLIVRSHPLGRGDYAPGAEASDRIRLLDSTTVIDVNRVLPAIEVLITDYSSIAYDYSLVGGPMVFLAADVDAYAADRGLYETYRSFTGGRHVATWPHVLERLDALAADPAELAAARAHSRWLRDEHFDYLDGRAAERVLAEIAARQHGAQVSGASPAPRPAVTAARFDGTRLQVEITGATGYHGMRLVGPRAQVDAGPRGFDLLGSRWGRPGLALPSGDYRLTLLGDPDTTRITLATRAPSLRHGLFHASLEREAGGVALRVRPPLAPGERRPVPHRDIGPVWLRGRVQPENAVYFESFYGRSASDNPAAIDRVLAARHPEVRRYWSVEDGSIAVPDGAIRIIEGSAEWWRVRAAARVYVINDWLRWGYRKRRHQKVLQTWHGTMLKRLALDRPDTTARTRSATRRQSWRWDALLAQNPYSADIFRRAYAMKGPIWETGYPRNDVLRDEARAAEIRMLLGIRPRTTVVLYAPTWRDDRAELIDQLDLVGFAADLPADHLLLVRGHSRTLAHGADVRAPRLLDVTSYPDVADLMLVADVLVTDYSSVMFDFAATGKPMIFFTPDVEHYGDVLRGFYFDLLAEAPGPVVTTREELRGALAEVEQSADKYAERYASWQAKFTPYDDGHAAERVVAQLYDLGWLG